MELKEEQFFAQVIQESQKTFKIDEERYGIATLDDLKQKLHLISLRNWLRWSTNQDSVHFILPNIHNSKITVEATLSVNYNLGTKAFFHNEPIVLSLNCLTDIRQIEILLIECKSSVNDACQSDPVRYHVNSARTHIIGAIDHIENYNRESEPELEVINQEHIPVSTYLPRLQFVLCQIENVMVPNNRRRYNILTQVCQLVNLYCIILIVILILYLDFVPQGPYIFSLLLQLFTVP